MSCDKAARLGTTSDVAVLTEATPQAGASFAADHILSAIDSKHAVVSPAATTPTKGDTLSASSTAAEEGGSTPPPRSKFRLTFILIALFLSLFVAALDATIVATAVPVISHELNSAVGYTWIGGAYLIANAVAAPIWGKFSDIWGRKAIMLSALIIFLASSIVCATATTMKALIIGRTIQGTAGGGLLLLVHIVISDLFSVRQRSLVMGLTEGIWATAGGVGPPLGGVFASLVSWRWCFYINLPLCGVAFLLILIFLDVKHEKTDLKTGLKAVDWIGIFCFLAFTLMVLLGLDFGGEVFPWDSAKVLALIIVGVFMLGAFIYSEAKLARYPLIPLSIFKDRSNVAALAVTAFHGLAFIPGEYYFPLYLQSCKGKSPVMSGVILIPLITSTAVVGVIAGVVIHRTGRFRELIWAGTALLCLGDGLFVMLDANSSLAKVIGLTIVFGAGSGMLFEPPLIALQTRIDQRDVATATSTFNFVRSMAVAVSIILGGVVFQNSMDIRSNQLSQSGLPANTVEALSGKEAAANVALASTISDAMQRSIVKDAFAFSIRNMWIMYTALAACGVVAGVFVGKSKLSRDHVETVTGIRAEKVNTSGDVEMV